MSAFEAKNELVRGRQDKVQSLVIPLTIAGSATAANVVCRNDEPGFVFLQTEGVDQITAALSTNETVTYTTAANDANGIFRILVKIDEPVVKVCGAFLSRRSAAAQEPVFLGSATGITTGSGGGQSIMLVADSALALNSGSNTLDACLIVQYVAE